MISGYLCFDRFRPLSFLSLGPASIPSTRHPLVLGFRGQMYFCCTFCCWREVLADGVRRALMGVGQRRANPNRKCEDAGKNTSALQISLPSWVWEELWEQLLELAPSFGTFQKSCCTRLSVPERHLVTGDWPVQPRCSHSAAPSRKWKPTVALLFARSCSLAVCQVNH